MKKIIEIKNWNDYSFEEKNKLLQHWWHYYGKMMYTLQEWEEFNKLVEKDADRMFIFAIGSYIMGTSSQPLICAMRQRNVDEVIASLPEKKELEDNEMYFKIENSLISQLVKSYNDPQPVVPMKNEDIKEQMEDLLKRRK